MKAKILKERCGAQGTTCPSMLECPENAIFYTKDENETMGGRLEVDPQRCTGCEECVSVCCGDAIVME